MPHGIAQPKPYIRRQVRAAVQMNDSRIVDHLDVNHQRIFGLDDLVIAVVGIRSHRRHGGYKDKAAILKPQIPRAFRVPKQFLAAMLFGGGGWRESRDPAVW